MGKFVKGKPFIRKVLLRYTSVEFPDFDIHLRTLKNKQQFSDDDKESEKLGINSTLWPIFGVVWDSGKVMADLMCTEEIEGKRILEVGCGIGLSSLVLNQRLANITATDYHPEAKVFLEENVELNNKVKIKFHLQDWASTDSTLGKFDLIIGSDLLYQDDHVLLLSSFINRHADTKAEVIMASPKRGYQNKFTTEMLKYGFSLEVFLPDDQEDLEARLRCHIHRYKR
ncbi:MAG: histidine kinase [Halobacteriovorax sp.]|nr:histidine kinase [Halobacteriovorax sp.]